jgi:thiamine pyrophosphate-dependent acetolactate synthase large subunit-like protein
MQKDLLSNLLKRNPNAVFVCSLGTISYDMKELIEGKDLGKREVYFVPGAMGCVMGIGLGYALSSKKKVIVLVGDGSYAMKMGSVLTIGAYNPKNLELHLFENNIYASTGGQSINFDFPSIEWQKKNFKPYEILR